MLLRACYRFLIFMSSIQKYFLTSSVKLQRHGERDGYGRKINKIQEWSMYLNFLWLLFYLFVLRGVIMR